MSQGAMQVTRLEPFARSYVRAIGTMEPPATIPSQGEELATAYLDLVQRYEQLVHRNVAGVFRSTLQGRLTECNDSLARMLGYADREALMRVPVRDLYLRPEDR
jgi:PAS domain-containing protein